MQRGGNLNCYYSTIKKEIKNEDYYSNINTAVALGKIHVPLKHKQLASNYVLIKKIFGSSIASIPITNADRATLSRHGFLPLENSTVSQVNRQIDQLKSHYFYVFLDCYKQQQFFYILNSLRKLL